MAMDNSKNDAATSKERRLLDFAVREDGVPPPISLPVFCGGRVGLGNLLNTSLILFFFWYGFRAWGWWGFGCLWVPICQVVMQLGDVLSSQAPSRNIRNLRSQGYSDFTILAYHQLNLIQSQLLSFLVCGVLAKMDPKMDDWKYVVVDRLWGDGWTILGRIVVTLASTEAAFTLAHGILHSHPRFMKIHVFHHCCTTPSFSTNLLFHPLDLMMEFSGPLLLVLGWNVYFAKQQHDADDESSLMLDGVTLVATYTLFQLWYAWDHDEHLNLPHIQHHAQCNSNFSVYVSRKMPPSWNPLRNHMYSQKGIDWGKNGKRNSKAY